MKAVMISIQPQWCEKIANGRKTIEVRKTIPKLQTPFKCYIYCTNAKPYIAWADVFRGNWETEISTIHGYSRKSAEEMFDIFNGSVMGEFVCDYIFPIDVDLNIHDELPGSPMETWLTWDDAPEQYAEGADIEKATCLSMKDIDAYIGSGSGCFCWHISDLKIYDNPKRICEFEKFTEHGIRPCETGFECNELYYDEQEHDIACRIDYSGDACPFVKMQRPPQSWCYVEEL